MKGKNNSVLSKQYRITPQELLDFNPDINGCYKWLSGIDYDFNGIFIPESQEYIALRLREGILLDEEDDKRGIDYVSYRKENVSFMEALIKELMIDKVLVYNESEELAGDEIFIRRKPEVSLKTLIKRFNSKGKRRTVQGSVFDYYVKYFGPHHWEQAWNFPSLRPTFEFLSCVS